MLDLADVAQHCIFLDSPAQANRFHRHLLDAYLKLNSPGHPKDTLNIAIVGAGATGVELAAELYHAAAELNLYGFDDLRKDRLNISLIEAGPRILPALPERIANSALKELQKLGVKVRTSTKVTAADAAGLQLGDEHLEAELMVWAAGIKAPDFLASLDGLATNRLNQLLVNPKLQTTNDSRIYAIGDCAGFPLPDGKWVPPRAQSAHQMASLVALAPGPHAHLRASGPHNNQREKRKDTHIHTRTLAQSINHTRIHSLHTQP